MAQKKKSPSFFQYIILGLIIMSVLGWFFASEQGVPIKTSEGLTLLAKADIKTATVEDNNQKVMLELVEPYTNEYDQTSRNVYFLYTFPQGGLVAQALQTADIKEGYDSIVPQENFLTSLIQTLIPIAIMLVLFYFIMSSMNGSGNPMQFARSKSKLGTKEIPKVKFDDVKGEDEAVEELQEVKDFLTNNKKYLALGAKIPRGVLLYGPPGNGKTLLAKAVAGEAHVPFFSMSGSDFVEMFVGVGASRVRNLFEQAKASSPSIIFIDEIDAVGRHRGSGLGGGHDEREQTLNQLLVEMDGFSSKNNVILIAATNRPDILDPALLRPGRFDRQVSVVAPDMKGRLGILQVHSKGKPLAQNVDLQHVAKRTPGFSGADLANIMNEAALLTARVNKNVITMDEIDESIDRVMAGPQRKSMKSNQNELRNTAYHEGGHALVAAALNYTDPVTKVTILPRGQALGYTAVMPEDDKYSVTRNELLDEIAYAMGGRVAEEVVFHDPTTGASNDIEKATKVAYDMVTIYGMTEDLGAVKIGSHSSEPIYGHYDENKNYSEKTAEQIDKQVHQIIETAHDEAYQIIMKNRAVLDHLVTELLKKETLLEPELNEIFKDLIKPPKRKVWLSNKKRPVSEEPPVDFPKNNRPPTPPFPGTPPNQNNGQPFPPTSQGPQPQFPGNQNMPPNPNVNPQQPPFNPNNQPPQGPNSPTQQ